MMTTATATTATIECVSVESGRQVVWHGKRKWNFSHKLKSIHNSIDRVWWSVVELGRLSSSSISIGAMKLCAVEPDRSSCSWLRARANERERCRLMAAGD